MKVYASESKVARLRLLAKQFLLYAQRNRRWVSLKKLRHFCVVAVSMILAILLSRFYTRSLYFDMALSGLLVQREERGQSRMAASRAELGRPRRCQGEVPAGWDPAARGTDSVAPPGTVPGTLSEVGRSTGSDAYVLHPSLRVLLAAHGQRRVFDCTELHLV